MKGGELPSERGLAERAADRGAYERRGVAAAIQRSAQR